MHAKPETVIIRLHGTTLFKKKKILSGSVFTSFNRQIKFHSHKNVSMYVFTFTGENQLQNQRQLEEE